MNDIINIPTIIAIAFVVLGFVLSMGYPKPFKVFMLVGFGISVVLIVLTMVYGQSGIRLSSAVTLILLVMFIAMVLFDIYAVIDFFTSGGFSQFRRQQVEHDEDDDDYDEED